MRDKRFGSRLNNQSFTIDFAGRKINENKNIDFKSFANEVENILTEKTNQTNIVQQSTTVVNQDIDSIKLKVNYLSKKRFLIN